MERSTIKLEVSLINKIKEIQALNCYKSVNETVKHILPQGTVTPEIVTYEQPAFTLKSGDIYKNISWSELKLNFNCIFLKNLYCIVNSSNKQFSKYHVK